MAIECDTIKQRPSKHNLPYVVPDIIKQILLRLPVKSLLRFRSVSKSWLSMISDPKFVEEHVKICSKGGEIAHHNRFLSFTDYDTTAIVTCHLSSIFNGPSVKPLDLDYLTKHTDFSVLKGISVNTAEGCVYIVGSINGLVCIRILSGNIYLWNPSTRISKILPDLVNIILGKYDCFAYGFGYDKSTDDYKVVFIAYTPHENVYDIVNEVVVYSSRSGFWKRIDDFPLNICLYENGVFVNGAIHWPAVKHTVQQPDGYWVIVSLDLANETYGEMASPTFGRDDDSTMRLSVLDECLCVLHHYHGAISLRCTDVWMMREYGVRDSWIKLTTITGMNGIHRFQRCPWLLHLSENSEILMEFEWKLALYDIQSNAFRNHDIINFDFNGAAVTYVESLVSPLVQQGFERRT